MIETNVSSLAVRERGEGRPAVLWHSLFMDERSWERVEEDLSAERRLVLIAGPGDEASADPGRRYTMKECAAAAAMVLDVLGISEPVDWVGNAWGGDVGVIFAATSPARCRTLVTLGTPVQASRVGERVETLLLLLLYRSLGPVRLRRGGHHALATDAG